jgi:ribonuclease J
VARALRRIERLGKLPRPGWENLKVVITSAFARMYRRTGRADFVDQMAPHGISAARLAETPESWVVMVRSSLIRDYVWREIAPNADDAWSWSMWLGYQDNEDGMLVRKWFEKGESRAAHIHTSGHASPADLRSFAHAMNARQLVPVHGIGWDGDTTGFPSLRRLADGESRKL